MTGNVSRLIATVAIVCAPLVTLGACSKFRAAKPDENQIMSIKNSSLLAPDTVRPPAQPTPLPVLPWNEGDLQPFIQPPPDPSPIQPLGQAPEPTERSLGTPQPVDPNIPPFNAFGRLEYIKNGQNWWCTAELVGGSGDIVMTAAHCVFDNATNRWGSNFIFRLGYNNGTSKQTFDWDCAATFTGWAQKHYRKDYAFLKIRGNSTAALGLRVGLPASQWTSVGYPGNFGGGHGLHKVDGNRGRAAGGTIEMTGNAFGGGASGGAWISSNFAIGVNSFKYDNSPNSVWGPLFDGHTTRLYEYVRRGCQDDVIPLGSDPRVAQYDKATTVIETTTASVDYGPRISVRKTSDCPCENAEEVFLENSSKDSYVTDISYSGSSGNPPSVLSSDTLSMMSEAGKSRSIGCTFGDKSGNLCPVALRFSLTTARRTIEPGRASKTTEIQSVTPEFCANECLNNLGGGYCLSLGTAAKPILVPLAGFVTETLDRPPGAGNVTTTVKELITAFQGDPNMEDPCGRSDFFRVADDVSNHGIACIATTPSLEDTPDSARISLRSPPLGVAQRKKAANTTGSSASFSVRRNAPLIEFHGTNSEEINRRFGGYVVNVERRSGKLIVTTENGCSVGSDQ